jgi:ketosteroid isomerase-like protein
MSEREDIEQLIFQHFWAIDDRDFDEVRRTLADDCVHSGTFVPGQPPLRIEGADAMVAHVVMTEKPFEIEQGLVTNVFVQVDGDEATARFNRVETFPLAGSETNELIRNGLRIRFGLRRSRGGWIICSSDYRLLWSENGDKGMALVEKANREKSGG